MILTRYKITVATDHNHNGLFLPFEASVTASNEKSAIRKAKYQARQCGLKTGRIIEVLEDSRFEVTV